jgi:peptide/nickel transport system substrate-binding protein
MNERSGRTEGVTRRTLLGSSASAVAALSLAGCDLLSTDPRGKGSGRGGQGRGGAKEAPTLAELVEQGKLPPLKDRLPENPLVVDPVERTGVHGGTWHTALVGSDDSAWMERLQHYGGLVRYSRDWSSVVPDVAEAYDVNDDRTEYVFHLRAGMKWSDGVPFTADDVTFWFDDVFMNDEITPTKPPLMLSGGKPPEVEKVDDLTVAIRYETSHGLLARYLAGGNGLELINKPRHYLEKFHKSHVPDEIDQIVEDAGFEEWFELFLDRADWSLNPDLPTLSPWVLETPYDGSTTRVVAKRNPYYWKVDTEGKQLPYIDEIEYQILQTPEVVLLKALGGELDMHSRHINIAENKPVLARDREKGNFRFFDLLPDPMNSALLLLNVTHPDPVKRSVFANKDFRIGLSHALNRQEIIDAIYRRQGEPWQSSPRKETGFYNEQLATQFIAYDVDLANEYLDRAGYDRKDGDGFRLGPDGERIRILFDVASEGNDGPEFPDVAEFVGRYWRNVGVETVVKTVSPSLVEAKRESNEQDISMVLAFGGINVVMDPRAYFPQSGNEYGAPWVEWYETRHESGERPPERIRRQMALYDQLQTTVGEDEQANLMKEILAITAEEFLSIGINLPAKGYGIVRNDFHNVPKEIHSSTGAWFPDPGPTDPCQYFTTRT